MMEGDEKYYRMEEGDDAALKFSLFTPPSFFPSYFFFFFFGEGNDGVITAVECY